MAINWLFSTALISFFFFFFGCGNTAGEGDDAVPPFPANQVVALASISFAPLERTSQDVELSFSARLQIPNEVDVLQGNSGVGWASLLAGGSKFCYQGNAISERTGGGNVYFLRHEAPDLLSLCSLGGEVVFGPEAQVEKGSVVRLTIENAGCSIESGTCQRTRARAVLEVLQTFL